MSGGVGATGSDIMLAREEEEQEMKLMNSTNKTHSPNGGRLFSMRQLNALAVVVVLSASGMVSLEDFVFLVSSLAYIFFLSKTAFPVLPAPNDEAPIFENNRLLGIYVSVGALIGILVPIVYIFHGIIEGDKEGIRAAAPHVFLLASQIFMEGVTFTGNRFSLPIRVFVPVFYNAKRIITIMEWLRAEIGKVDVEDGGSDMRLQVGRGLAVANMVFWCYNLFGFLLPVYLPRAFKRYYGGGGGEYKIKN